MELIPVLTPMVERGDVVVDVLIRALREQQCQLQAGDIVAVADKIMAIAEGRTAKLDTIDPSQCANTLASKYHLEPPFVELVLREADEVLGGVARALLTTKNGIIIANAGIDHKNAPDGTAALWPTNPNDTAANLRRDICENTGNTVGVILVDSHVIPMRMGTVGFALGIAGFNPVLDCRGVPDLYGQPLVITRFNIADDLAAAAHYHMGETTQRVPFVIIRDSGVEMADSWNPDAVKIPQHDCMFMTNLRKNEGDPCQPRRDRGR
jgi:coenzyme F420-0:L-glutamate ligase